jgi:hypothetical protein
MVEMSTFGSEFIALKTAVEMVEGSCYMLCMLGVPMEGAANVFLQQQICCKEFIQA